MQPKPVSSLTDLLRQIPLPAELEITILPFPEDIDDISFLKDGIHLGIHAPHVPELAREFRKVYYGLRKHHMNTNADTNASADADADGGRCGEFKGFFMESISCLLLLCPDHATAWSDRKRTLLRQLCDNSDTSIWGKELGFLNLLFTQHSKAPNAWSHRRWVCKQILKEFISQQRQTNFNAKLISDESNQNQLSSALDLFFQWAKDEIRVCVRIAEKYPKNYYAWTHRLFMIRTLVDMMRHNKDYCCEDDEEGEFEISVRLILQSEIDSIEPWLRRHVSDHSAAHYGGQVYGLWLSKGSKSFQSEEEVVRWRVGELQEMLESSRGLIEKFQSHEVMWIWRRIIASLLFQFLLQGEKSGEIENFIHEEISMAIQREDSYCKRDCELSKAHASSYIVWILKHAKQLNLDIVEDGDISAVQEYIPRDKFMLLYLLKTA